MSNRRKLLNQLEVARENVDSNLTFMLQATKSGVEKDIYHYQSMVNMWAGIGRFIVAELSLMY